MTLFFVVCILWLPGGVLLLAVTFILSMLIDDTRGGTNSIKLSFCALVFDRSCYPNFVLAVCVWCGKELVKKVVPEMNRKQSFV
ncbi:MAG: hypothetical protein BWY75_01418 [bacterium ADurb.Bin425]|nr:MAG: hypothetical protein BWY75_01418 [bacterium ADurb.Bin425]